jgi:hypothetical protein
MKSLSTFFTMVWQCTMLRSLCNKNQEYPYWVSPSWSLSVWFLAVANSMLRRISAEVA